jgi:excisionase family DNA binding protein
VKSLSVHEAADLLGVSDALVYSLCAQKRIRHERHGLGRGTIRIPEDAIDEYRKSVTVAPVGPALPVVTKPPKLKHLKL